MIIVLTIFVFSFLFFFIGTAYEYVTIKEKVKRGLTPFIDADDSLAWRDDRTPEQKTIDILKRLK